MIELSLFKREALQYSTILERVFCVPKQLWFSKENNVKLGSSFSNNHQNQPFL